ncbi:MAG TPA: ADP-glyceromanno-heptose 6-epimerase [Xanthobacteraceae bacterium]|jgi:ADP-L-glycero-D-manno-heptose 6-epimerase
MILVTGGAGFIGSNLVAGLNERGVGDIAIADQIDGAKRKNLDKRRYAETVAPADLLRWLQSRKLRAILHMGAISSTTVTDEDMVMRNNFELPVRLLEWCAETRIPLIYASSAATYGDGAAGFDDDDSPEALSKLKPLNLYGRSKARFDLWAVERAKSGGKMPPQWVGLKYFNVFGPNEYHKDEMRSVVCKAFPDAKAGKPVRLFASDRAGISDGGHARDFIYVKDVAAVSLWLLDNPRISGIYNVGTGQARSFNDLIHALFRALKREPRIEYFEMPANLRGQYQHRTEARMERLRAAGYDAPFTPLETAVEDYVTHYLDRDDPYR